MPLMDLLIVVALIVTGLIAGLFFTFSTFVMPALAQLPPAHGIVAMQRINQTVMNPITMGVFMGTALLSVALVALSIWHSSRPDAIWLLIGGLLYALGGFGITAVGNVPMNEALAAMPAEDPSTAEYWQHYLKRWTTWNTCRTVATTLAMAALSMALVQ